MFETIVFISNFKHAKVDSISTICIFQSDHTVYRTFGSIYKKQMRVLYVQFQIDFTSQTFSFLKNQVLCLFFYIMSLLCLLICVPSTFWLESENLRFGLWSECSSVSVSSNNENLSAEQYSSTIRVVPKPREVCTHIERGKA